MAMSLSCVGVVVSLRCDLSPVAQDGHDAGDRWVPGEAAGRPERQVYRTSHAGPPGEWVAAPYCCRNNDTSRV